MSTEEDSKQFISQYVIVKPEKNDWIKDIGPD